MTRVLAEVARTLEAADDAPGRVRRALKLGCELLGCGQCALLRSIPDAARELIVVPHVSDEDRVSLERRLSAVYQLMADDETDVDLPQAAGHLTLPVMGLDQVIGVITVSAPLGRAYETRHVRLLSVVAAQLGAFLALLAMHAEQEAQKRDLQVVNEVQRNLAGIVSHDLRTPLSVITTVASSLLQSATEPRQIRALERALRNAQKASRIIHDLLDVTQARVSGRIDTIPVECDLRSLVGEVVEDQREAHPGRDFVFEDEVAGEVRGWWDADRLSQLLNNLIGNALAHGDPVSPVTVRLSVADGTAKLVVHNHGAPILAELLPSIFDPFRRGHEARPRGGGIGLGLYIVDQIARSHGGVVEVASSKAAGTSFMVSLPVRLQPERDADRPAAKLLEARPLILVVDDDEELRTGMADMLGRIGYEVTVATNGEEALALLRRGYRPRLMLVDVHMPVMDGPEFCALCSQDPELAKIPVLVITGDAAAALQASKQGLAGVLMKPVQPQIFVDTVARAVR